MEAYQRSQALVLVQDMADRIAANKGDAGSYVADDMGLTVVTPCPTTSAAATDKCEWANKLAGAAEITAGGTKVGAMLGARGCVTTPSTNVYMVTIAWQGMSRAGSSTPGATCGASAYGTGQRRTVSTIVRVPLLGAT
jgi:type IV pilus assembly protein PilV